MYPRAEEGLGLKRRQLPGLASVVAVSEIRTLLIGILIVAARNYSVIAIPEKD